MGGIELYLANEFGFEDPGREFVCKEVVPTLEKIGYVVLEPFRENFKNYDWKHINSLKTVDARNNALIAADLVTGANNIILMNRSKVLAAILDGSHTGGIGVGSEIGYYFSKGRPIIAVRTDFRLAENPTSRVDIQVTHFITHSPSGKFCASYPDWYAELKRFYESFKR
jgi:nucleoside 2-deoxyribosyltransferase